MVRTVCRFPRRIARKWSMGCFFDVYGKMVCKLSRWRKSLVLLSTHLILWQFINRNDRHGSPKSTASFSEILTVNLRCFLVSNGTQWRFPDGSERTAWCVWHRAGSFSSIYSQSLKEKEKKKRAPQTTSPPLLFHQLPHIINEFLKRNLSFYGCLLEPAIRARLSWWAR